MLTGKCDVRTANPAFADRGLVVRVASMSSFAVPPSLFAVITSVADNASDVQLLALSTGRIKFSIVNDSTAVLYVAIGGQTASTTQYSVPILPGQYFESLNDIASQMEVRGIWASDPNTGAARITVYT